MRSVSMSAILAIFTGLLVHTYDCSVGTYEQCLMSRGLLWFYIVVMFAFFLALIAAVNLVMRYLKGGSQ